MSEGMGRGRARGRGGRGRKTPQADAPGQQQGPPQMQAQQPPPPGGAGAAGGGQAPMGRGRSRGARQVPQATAPPPQGAMAAPPQGGPGPESVTGGRGVSRGGGRERPNGGNGNGNGDGGVPVAQMGQLDIGGRGEYRRREPYERYIEKRYREESHACTGTSGQPTTILANYFPVGLPADKKIYQYHVDFKPFIENVKVKYALIASLSEVIGTEKIFDGGILYLTRILPKDPSVHYCTRTYDSAQIQLTFTRVCEVMPSSPQFLQIANILMKKVQIALGMNQIRDHYYNVRLSAKVDKHKLEVIPGFTTSIHAYDGGCLLGIDMIHKILRTDTFLDGMYDLYSSLNPNDKASLFQELCFKKFVGSIVMTRHNNKTYKVDDIAWEMRPKDTFEKGGEKVSYVNYYKEHWNIQIHDMEQPLLVSRPTERDRRRGDTGNLYLIPELCTVTGLSDEARSNFTLMKDLATHTRIGPKDRVKTLERFSAQINDTPAALQVLAPLGMMISRDIMQVGGRLLPPETLSMSQQRGGGLHALPSYDPKEADWSRNMRNVRLLQPVHMEQWMIIYPFKQEQLASELSDCLSKVGRGMGMNISAPSAVGINGDRNEFYLQAIRQNLHSGIQMVLTVVPNNKKDRYDAIKKSCCIDNPVPSQVVMAKTLQRKQGLMSVATKIAIQLNCKMGGQVWQADIPMKGTMIIGLDSYHDSANKNQSVGAMVASLNQQCTLYYSKTEYHDKRSEIMQNLSVLVSGALRSWHEKNGSNPSRVLVYRDGVGDGQLDVVFHSEKEQIEQAFRNAGGEGFKPNLAIIIVKKRINTRLFLPSREGITNPLPGTVVDQGVTKSEWYDFFLVSQSVRQGTVSPTSYNVIYDQSNLKPDHFQRLTYKLCHLYFNWQGTIRVPAPCQYAHKLAFLQGQSLHREFSAHLSDKLFFL